ncbi:nuclear transcription factor Y subunit beta-like [Pollicipes pollicipes]|uniref:nuclear transcription factor Y subunit beta-like n=1 Tax=Pollicipes pollicipes TaxID=41117 RepID=UPI0018853117|nr:nuclear transcription factor Y subunit beta-like [Pollicipes pollicipes]XP_037093199.1 nuclear transcription factor Y subunit beta-like [Pollicipes pollicipes]XP_037093201.1 nuclear transcription factor Y subunit beta-like [Pollicipes pollicipes]XP_037093202.1 nuclear transcription factor Y subunit beta-like [Pollicipes pollicipes]
MDGDGSDFIADSKYMLEDSGDHDSGDGGAGGSKSGEPSNILREQDRFLPIANVARIMKRGIPPNGKIAKESRECMQECVSEFVSFVTSEASDRCHQEKRKTINGEDLLFAMSVLGFDSYVEPLKLYLQKYRESMKGDKLPEQYDEMDEPHFSTSALESLGETVPANGATGGMIYTTYGNQQFQLN